MFHGNLDVRDIALNLLGGESIDSTINEHLSVSSFLPGSNRKIRN